MDLEISFQITNHLTGEVNTRNVIYPFNYSPVRISNNISTHTVNQNETLSLELPFDELDSFDTSENSSYDLRISVTKIGDSTPSIAEFGNRVTPHLNFESKKFSIDWKIECPSFEPGDYQLFFNLTQIKDNENFIRAYNRNGWLPLNSQPVETNIAVANLTINANSMS